MAWLLDFSLAYSLGSSLCLENAFVITGNVNWIFDTQIGLHMLYFVHFQHLVTTGSL